MISQFFFLLLLITTSSFVLILLIKQKTSKAQATRLPPGPWKLPLIGNLHQLTGDSPHVSLQKLSNEYGPLMFLQLGSLPTLVISSADVARDIFRTHDLIFSGRPELYAAKIFSYNCSNIAFAPYGEYWREIRKIAILELLGSKRVQSFQAVRNEEVADMIKIIARSSAGPTDLSRLIFLLANNIICRVTFGRKYDSEADTGTTGFDVLMREMQAVVAESKILQQHLDPRRPKPEHEDLVDVLVRIQKDSSQAVALSNEQIKSLLTDIFVAGTDTSSATLGWTMTEFIRNPSVMRRAQNEVRGVVKGREVVEESDISELMYLKLVVKEALRLHPPAPLLVPRETTEDCRVGEYEIPSGTRVLINAKAIATDPEHWEHPFEFRPERFLNSSIDLKGNNFELIPFGVGRRGCPGMNFAMPLIELALANLLHRFDWKLPPGMRIEDLDMEEAPGMTMHKKNSSLPSL
ncbi:cytochrome P450 71A22 [Citrus sinensis]|uniref:Cytochrome P450 71A22 n=1 Tax=Citrus sinensis TaxID=2711 RepID=A0ACB8LSV1_CITSI|nr:cytochrome P450 71A22 [Citrus sinensis]